jgi:hypothetical protein
MTYITDLAADLRDNGWTDGETRINRGMAVCEFHRGQSRKWALVDTATNLVVGGRY